MKSNHEQQKKHTSTHSAILLTTRRCFHNIAIKLIKINPWFHQFLKQKKILSCTSLQGFYQVNQPESIWENDGKWLGTVFPCHLPWTCGRQRPRDMFQSSPLLHQASQWVSHETDFDLGSHGDLRCQWYPEKGPFFEGIII